MNPTVLQTFDLTIGYSQPRQPDLRIAEGLNLFIKKGELVCLLGPNGAGKSTLMRTIAGMQKPLAGNIQLNGDEIHKLSARQLAKRLSIVLTERPNLGLLNGYALVALGRHPYTDWTGRLNSYDEAIVRWAVEAVGAQDIAKNPVMELSDGQRQKLLIARALAQEPELMLLDEPTAFLDLPRRVEMMRLLKFLARHTQRAILLSTHDLDLALRTADTLWLMSNGEIQAGSPEDLVLSGAFEKAFQSEGVEFDRLTGAFRVAEHGKALVVLEGEGIPLIWTRRALEREGYGVISHVNGTPPIASISIEGDEQNPMWCMQIGEQHSLHTHISGLIEELKNQTPN